MTALWAAPANPLCVLKGWSVSDYESGAPLISSDIEYKILKLDSVTAMGDMLADST